jgi:hypothetical protein
MGALLWPSDPSLNLCFAKIPRPQNDSVYELSPLRTKTCRALLYWTALGGCLHVSSAEIPLLRARSLSAFRLPGARWRGFSAAVAWRWRRSRGLEPAREMPIARIPGGWRYEASAKSPLR